MGMYLVIFLTIPVLIDHEGEERDTSQVEKQKKKINHTMLP
jgi:hypothetical protein